MQSSIVLCPQILFNFYIRSNTGGFLFIVQNLSSDDKNIIVSCTFSLHIIKCFQIIYHDSKSNLYQFGRNDIRYEVASFLHFYDDEIRHANS